MPTAHPNADFQALLDSASHYIVAHGAGAGLELLPPVWDGGMPRAHDPVHNVRVATPDAAIDLSVPHDWLPLDSDGHNRFRTEVETVLTELRRKRSN